MTRCDQSDQGAHIFVSIAIILMIARSGVITEKNLRPYVHVIINKNRYQKSSVTNRTLVFMPPPLFVCGLYATKKCMLIAGSHLILKMTYRILKMLVLSSKIKSLVQVHTVLQFYKINEPCNVVPFIAITNSHYQSFNHMWPANIACFPQQFQCYT